MRSLSLLIFLLTSVVFFSCESPENTQLSHAQDLAADKKYKEAIAEYTKLINKRKLVQPALYYRGIAYLEVEKYKEALEDYNRLIGFHSQNGYIFTYNESNPLLQPKADEISVVKAFFRRGQTLYYMDSLDRAFWDFQFCIDQKFAAESTCHLWQGYIRLKQGNKQKACLAFESAKQAARDALSLQEAEAMLKENCQKRNYR